MKRAYKQFMNATLHNETMRGCATPKAEQKEIVAGWQPSKPNYPQGDFKPSHSLNLWTF